MSDDRTEYTLNDVDAQDPVMLHIMQAVVQQLTVEFLRSAALKPHVVFKMNFTQPVTVNGSTFTGCRLGMEYAGQSQDGRDDATGEFQIKPINYQLPSERAHAAFLFETRQSRRIWEYIYLFRGWLGNDRTDLTAFHFVQPNPSNYELDGCRDFISQCFLRLYINEFVAWQASQAVKGIFNQQNLPSFHFHHIIGNNYRTEGDNPTRVDPLPLYRGTFLSGYQRREDYHDCALPYIAQTQVPQTQAPEPAATSSAYPAGGSSYAGPSSSTSQSGYQDDYNDYYQQGVPSSSTSQSGYQTTPDYPYQSSYTSQPGYQTNPYSQYPSSSTSQPEYQDNYDSYNQEYSSSSTSRPGNQDNYDSYYQGDPSSSTSQPAYQSTPDYQGQSSSGAGRTDRSSRRERHQGRRRR